VSGPRVWIGPGDDDGRIAAAVTRGGGAVAPDPVDADAVVWLEYSRPEELLEALNNDIRWVQLPAAGVERWLDLVDGRRTWTGAQGAYAGQVAEHAAALVLAASKHLPQAARARSWGAEPGRPLEGATVGIVGAGAIGRALAPLLAPFGVRILAQTRSGRTVDGAERTAGADGLAEVLRESDYVVLAAPLTRETRGLMGASELDLIGPDGWLVNVARGALVRTDDLVAALREGRIGGACLDVTDPEPLPDDHPLWGFPNVLITPHVANPPAYERDLLAARVEENVRRFAAGEELAGRIDPERGY